MSHCLSCPLCHEVVAHQCRNLEAQKHPSMSCGIICKIGKEASSHPNSINNRQLEEDSSQRDFITDHFIRCHQIVVLTEDENCMPLAKRKRKRCDRDVDGNSFYCHICRLTFLDPEPAKNRDKNNSNDAVVKEKELEDKHKYKLVPGRNGQKIVIPSFMKQHLLPTKKDLPELLIKTEVDTETPEEVEKEEIDFGDDDFEDVLCGDMSEGDDVDLGDIDLGEMSEEEEVREEDLDNDATKVCAICSKELKNLKCLRSHMRNVHSEKSLKCGTCESVLKNPNSLSRHMRTVHRRGLKCGKCDLTFKNRSEMEVHKRQDHKKEAEERKDLGDDDDDFKDFFSGDKSDLDHLEVGEMSDVQEDVINDGTGDINCNDKSNTVGDKTKNVCKICHKALSSKKSLRSHIKNVHASESLKCELCESVLKNSETLSFHMKTVHKTRVECKQCDMTFKGRNAMVRHVRQKHKKDVKKKKEEVVTDKAAEVACETCGKMMRNAATLRRHMSIFHPKERPKCQQCDMTFDNRRALWIHNTVHMEKEECELCHDVLNSAGALRKHMWSVHGKKTPLVCKICQELQEDLDALRLHRSEAHPGESWNCKSCDQCFESSHLLRKHVREKHPRKKYGVETVKDATCKICGKFCKLRKHLEVHMRCFHSTQIRQCHLCHKVLKHQESYKHHMEYIHGDRDVPCTLCPSVLKSKASLRMHMSYSHAAESIACELCGSMLKSIPAFRQHMRTHHSTVRLACELCGKVMKHGSSMNAHMKRVHTMETTRVTCGHCQLSFHNNSYLRAHLEMVRKQQELNPKAADGSGCKEEQNCNHEGSNRSANICKTCGIPFPCPKTLEDHINTVHLDPLKDRDHLCQFCGKDYKIENSLRAHIKNWHKQEEKMGYDEKGLHKEHLCQFCGNGYKFENSLRAHIRKFHKLGEEEKEMDMGHDEKGCESSEAVVGGVGSMGGLKVEATEDVID